MPSKLIGILDYAVWAAADGGSAPWRLKVIDENTIELYPVMGLTPSPLTYAAHGAAIENMVIASALYGLSADVRLFPPVTERSELVARIFFNPTRVSVPELLGEIKKRAVNSSPFSGPGLTQHEERELRSATDGSFGFSVKIIDDPRIKELIAKILGSLERERLEKLISASLLKSWGNKLFKTVDRGVKEKVRLYADSPAIAAITMHRVNERDWVEGGRVFQRLWLKATKLGLALEPIRTDRLQERLAPVFDVKNETIAFVCRLGRATGRQPTPPMPLEKFILS